MYFSAPNVDTALVSHSSSEHDALDRAILIHCRLLQSFLAILLHLLHCTSFVPVSPFPCNLNIFCYRNQVDIFIQR